MTAIRAVGAYAPRFRITAEEYRDAWGRFQASGIETTAVPDADEDALTMAAEAATRALSAADLDGGSVGFLAFATTSPPLEEEDLTARLGSMLGVPDDATRHLFSGSTRAGTRAIAVADRDGATTQDSDSVALVVAADCPRGDPDDERDHAAGAGAAAFVLDGTGPARIVDRSEHASPYPGVRFKERGEDSVDGLDVTAYDRAAFTETLAGAVDGLSVGDPDAAAVQAPDGKLPYRATGALGVDSGTIAACETVSELGDTGAASVPLSVAQALADGHDRVLAASYGSGAGADALVVEREEEVPASLALDGDRELSYAEYLRRRGEITGGAPEGGGAYVSVPSWRRSIPQRHRLVAGECPDCDGLTFPPEGACTDCGSLGDFEHVQLPGTGTVEAATAISQGGAPPEFAEQQSRSGDYGVVIVAFDGPSADRTVSAPAMATDCEAGTLSVGDSVETTIRRIYTQEGVTRYGFKVRPVEED